MGKKLKNKGEFYEHKNRKIPPPQSKVWFENYPINILSFEKHCCKKINLQDNIYTKLLYLTTKRNIKLCIVLEDTIAVV